MVKSHITVLSSASTLTIRVLCLKPVFDQHTNAREYLPVAFAHW